ncbi:MAG: nickel pincer cofactor biosynthesis protein LarC [Thermodesulfobacteriota bacterium]
MLAYFDCFSGISGDMTLGALLDLGVDQRLLEEQLALLGLTGYSLNVERSTRCGISGIRFEVIVDSDQPHRSYRDIRGIIERSKIPDPARETALKLLEILADAEATVHGKPKDEIHFHEIGAVDSIVDIVGVALAIHGLGITRAIFSPLPMSRGFVKTEHGTIPTPAPATLEILKGVPVTGSAAAIELVTPTGAAIAKGLAQEFGPYPSFVPQRIGYGLGKSDPHDSPNALRVVLGAESHAVTAYDRVGLIECQVDDLDPRILGDLMDTMMERGALDVCFVPVQMKKNRPAILIRAMVPPHRTEEFARTLLSETSTIGVRLSASDRIVLRRRSDVLKTSLGDVKVKIVELPDGTTERRPEFDDVRAIARATGLPTRSVLRILEAELAGRE